MHLLVIEDERALCETIVRSLRRHAYSVDCCYDGEKALELLGVERYDLVLLDLNLPGKDGMTVLRTLRQFTQQDVLLTCGGLTFDTRSRTTTANGQTLTLTRKETGILEYLMVHHGTSRAVPENQTCDL